MKDQTPTPEDMATFNALLDRYSVIAFMDVIAAKYRDVPRPKRDEPGWSLGAIIFDNHNREFRFRWGPFAGEMPNLEDEKSSK